MRDRVLVFTAHFFSALSLVDSTDALRLPPTGDMTADASDKNLLAALLVLVEQTFEEASPRAVLVDLAEDPR